MVSCSEYGFLIDCQQALHRSRSTLGDADVASGEHQTLHDPECI
jgi:hypothetical protein